MDRFVSKAMLLMLPCLATTPVLSQPSKNKPLSSALEEDFNYHQFLEMIEVAQTWLEKGHLAQAREVFKSLENIGPEVYDESNFALIGLKLADLELKHQNYDEGMALLQKLKQKLPKALISPPLYWSLARAYTGKGDSQNAYDCLEKAQTLLVFDDWPSEDKSLFFNLKWTLNQKYELQAQRAERLFSSGLYQEATQLLESLRTALRNGHFPKYRNKSIETALMWAHTNIRLAEAYYHAQQYQKTIDILTSAEVTPLYDIAETKLEAFRKGAPYLLALSYREVGQYEKALDHLLKLLSIAKPEDEVGLQMDIATTYYKAKHFDDARFVTQKIIKSHTREASNPNVQAQARLLLAQVSLEQQDYQDVLEQINSIETQDVKQALLLDRHYLLGQTYRELQLYEQAYDAFEQSVIYQGEPPTKWQTQALLWLGDCAIGTAEQDEKEASVILSKAKNLLLSYEKNPKVKLLAARLCLHPRYRATAQQKKEDVQRILSQYEDFENKDLIAEALYILCLSQTDPVARHYFADQLSNERLSGSPWQIYGWYLKGASSLEIALQKPIDERKGYLEKAYEQFGNTVQVGLGGGEDGKRVAALAYLGQAKALAAQSSQKGKTLALDHLQRLMNNKELYKLLPAPEELLFLQGQVMHELSSLSSSNEDQNYWSLQALHAFNRIHQDYPLSTFADSALYSSGTLYFARGEYEKAEKAFTQTALKYPQSSWAAEALTQAANTAEFIDAPERAYAYRQKIYQDYPEAQGACENAFKLYSIEEYLSNSKEPNEHLRKFIRLYPHQPEAIWANYLLYLKAQKENQNLERHDSSTLLARAEECIRSFEGIFPNLSKTDKVDNEEFNQYVEIYNRSLLEKAQLLSENEQYGAAQNALGLILSPASNARHGLYQAYQNGALLSLANEARWLNGRILISQGDYQDARKVFEQLLQTQASGSALRFDTLCTLGELYLNDEQYNKALSYLQEANNSSQSLSRPTTERMNLQFMLAKAYKTTGQLDNALAALAKVLYEDGPRDLHAQAIWDRAEIFEQQGEDTLAQKQYQTLIKQYKGLYVEKARHKVNKGML